MTDTTHLQLPFIAASQAQKHVTHNEALRILDAVVQLSVLDATRTAPPSGPLEGQRHIIAASPTGVWAGKAGNIAAWQDGAWAFLVPRAGWCAWCAADAAMFLFNGTAWAPLPLGMVAQLGINTSASAPNLLSVRSNAALIAAIAAADGGSGDVRLQLTKESASRTASLVFADNFSGRAEIGLAGDDDVRIKVSPDGVTWLDALRIARASGKVSFPASGGPREMLAADRTYYVRSDGSDANPGTANSSGGAFLTIQKAVDTVCALDLSTLQATIQLADGAYGGLITLKPYLGALPPIVKGNAATPASVVISTTSSAFSNAGAGVWRVQDLKITTSGGHGLSATGGGTIRFQNIEFGAVAGYHIFAGPSSNIVALGGYAVSDGAQYHVAANGYVSLVGVTVSYTGAPAFSGANVLAGRGGVVDCFAMSFVNAAAVTGSRYSAGHNGVIFSNGGGASYLPGSSAGNTGSGGVYA